ncbi:hypothetical protein [Streptomyces sp. NBC_00483]|uniref:hypothetical protein n=1 Tax=Streptomyces sp. NBC_00483 TaxID=2975756 RepID=UPI002E19317D
MQFIKNHETPPIWPDEVAAAICDPNEDFGDGPAPADYDPYENYFLNDAWANKIGSFDSLYLQQFRPSEPCGCGQEFDTAAVFVIHAEDCLQAPEYRYEPAYRAIFTRRSFLASQRALSAKVGE